MPKPTPERRRQQDQANAYGRLLKAIDDASPPEVGVTKLPSTILAEIKENNEKEYCLKTGKFRYKKGVPSKKKGQTGRGGKFASPPPDAERIKKKAIERSKRNGGRK